MNNEISAVVAKVHNQFIQKWKDDDKKVIGYPCTFVPEEIIYAAGMLPVRLRGVEAVSTSIADSYYGPVICSYPKCILQLAGEGKYTFLDGAIICNGCDSMRRLDECWRKAGEDYKGIVPAYFHYFGVPHKVTQYSLKWFVDEIKLFVASLEEHFDVKISEDDLRMAIRVYNQGRILLGKLDKLRIVDNVPISGTDATAIIIASTTIPRDEFNSLLQDILASLEKKKKGISGKRLLLAGSVIDDVSLIKVIEDEGAVVVADTLCFGSRSYVDLVEEDGDPFMALAKRYLTHKFCPRMFGYYKDRYGFLKDTAMRAKVDGVILQNIRFCDLHGSENGIFERDLEASGIPCMRIEREYGPLAEEGRIRMRIDAFLERLA